MYIRICKCTDAHGYQNVMMLNVTLANKRDRIFVVRHLANNRTKYTIIEVSA